MKALFIGGPLEGETYDVPETLPEFLSNYSFHGRHYRLCRVNPPCYILPTHAGQYFPEPPESLELSFWSTFWMIHTKAKLQRPEMLERAASDLVEAYLNGRAADPCDVARAEREILERIFHHLYEIMDGAKPCPAFYEARGL